MLGDTIISITLLEVNIPFQFKMHSIEVKIITGRILISPHPCLITNSEDAGSLGVQGP